MVTFVESFGLPLVHALQSQPHWLGVMRSLSWLGSETFFLLFVSFFYWCVDARIGARVGLILLVSNSLNGLLKLTFASPRPQWVNSNIRIYASESSFGLPSAHAQNAAAVWGEVAWLARRPWLRGLALGLIGLIGLSRLYLGVHFPADVLVGWGIGLGVLFLFNRFSQPLIEGLHRGSLGQTLLVTLLSSGLLLFPTVLLAQWRASQGIASPPLALEVPIATAGTWLGFGGGLLWLSAWQLHAPVRGSWRMRVTRYVLGLGVAIALWAGLDYLFPEGTSFLAYFLRYLRYTLLGSWISAGAPWLFSRLPSRG